MGKAKTEGYSALSGQASLFPGSGTSCGSESLMESHSRYIRSSALFAAEKPLKIANPLAQIRFLSRASCEELVSTLRKKSLFARVPYDDNFYIGRVVELAESTISEVFLRGQPSEIIPRAKEIATFFEKVALLSTTFVLNRQDLQRNFAFGPRNETFIDITIGPRFYSLRSSSKLKHPVPPITIDDRFCKRFERCGFPELVKLCASEGGIALRTRSTVNWLFESRREEVQSAAIMKTAIALESLLIFDKSEPLARALSERLAFITSPNPHTRRRISSVVKKFYDARSGVVHGRRNGVRSGAPAMLEGIDRLTLLACLTIAANLDRWNSNEAILEWLETQRWGSPDTDVKTPFSRSYLERAINLCSAS